tara:strand:+ start:158 stop:433 length:276 start_codon:yes stop_codon:yes gene_type:complete
MKLSKEFIKGLIREQLTLVPKPEERAKQEIELLEKRGEELEAITSSLTNMGQYFQGVYPDFDSDIADIVASIGTLVEKIDDKAKEIENAEA